MADDDEEENGPVVELGEGEPVDGAPLARVSSRQTWGMEKSRLAEREGDTEIRTPDGPQRLGDVLESVDAVYFTRRQDFEDAVENVMGTGPVPTADRERDEGATDTDTDGGGETDSTDADESQNNESNGSSENE